LVFKLIELALSTASVERALSIMKIVMSKIHNMPTNECFNDLMICYSKPEIFRQFDEGAIAQQFQATKKRRKY
jgi:hypothetical protein